MKMKPSTKSKGGASRKELLYKVLKNLTADGIKEFASHILEEAVYIITLRLLPKKQSEQFLINSDRMVKDNFLSI